jgi:O-antigen/teichoic acid export membrane protein
LGIIQSQSIKGTFYIYLGLIIGFITSALIYPEYLTKEQIGLLAVLLSYSSIFSQFACLGTSRIVILAFPLFQNKEKKNHGILFIITAISFVGLILSLIILFIIKPYLLDNEKDASGLFPEYYFYLIPLIFFNLAFIIYDSYYKVLNNTVRGTVLKEFVQRVLFLVFIVFYMAKLIEFGHYVILYVVSTAIPPLYLLVTLIREKEFNMKPDFGFLTKSLTRYIADVGFYGILAGFGSIVITNVDRIIIANMLGLGATGVYATAAFFATIVLMPSRALYKIADPIIAQAWKKNDLEHISHLYVRSSLNQFIIGSLLFIGIWANIDNIFRILPPTFVEGKYVIFFIGLAFLSDMISGVAWFIVSNSKYYRLQSYLMLLLIILIVVSNILLIPMFGLSGSAAATFISKLFSNIILFVFLTWKYKLQPYRLGHLWIFIISLIAYFTGYIIPVFESVYIDILIRSTAITVVFALLIYWFKISYEFNERLEYYFNTYVRRKK